MVGILSVGRLTGRRAVDGAPAPVFSPSSLFAASEPGAWYDPSDIERYMATGSELVSNGDFSSGSTGWTLGSGWGVSSGVASVVAPGTTTDLSASITLTAGRTYRISCTISNYTAGSVTPRFTGGTSAIGSNFPLANGTFTQLLTANTGNNGLTIRANSTADLSVDNISVTELVNYSTATMFQDSAGTTPVTEVEQPVGLFHDRSGRGNHAAQSTSASRPVLSAKVNQLTYTEWFDNAVWIKSNTTITPNAFAAPDGSLMATKIEAAVNADIAGQQVYQALTTLGPGNYIYTIYAKQGSAANDSNTFAVRDNTAAVNHVVVSIDYSTGVLTQSAGSGATSTDVGNGWWRISMPFTLTLAAGNSIRFNVGSRGLTETVGEFCYAWGADVRLANSGVTLPVYQRVFTGSIYDTAGFPYYLKFDGVDDFLQTTTITPGTDKVQMFTGVRKLSDAASGIFIEMSATVNSNPGTFSLFAPSGTAANYSAASRGSAVSVVASYTNAAIAAPVTNQLSILSDISGDNLVLRVNGSDVAQSTSDQGTGNFTAQLFYIGRRAGTSAPFNGNLYSLIVRFGANLDASTIGNAEAWVNGKTRAY